jgi:hypothetical protein
LPRYPAAERVESTPSTVIAVLGGAVGAMLPDPLQFVHTLYPHEPPASLQRCINDAHKAPTALANRFWFTGGLRSNCGRNSSCDILKHPALTIRAVRHRRPSRRCRQLGRSNSSGSAQPNKPAPRYGAIKSSWDFQKPSSLPRPMCFLNRNCEKQMASMCLIVLSITFD